MISKIYHLADIHCRNLKRHREYRTVFDRVYKYIQDTKDEDSIIVIAGDIVHSKTEMSPELIDIVGEFFTKCATLCPTFVIPGNHDCNLNNLYRQDALSPIVQSLQLENLKYIKFSGVFTYKDVTFSHYSILEDKSKWITADKIDAKYKIALYHGPVANAYTDIGYKVTSGKVGIADFDGFDIALLGDIHKRQQLQSYSKRKNHAAVEFPGSLIQQNHSEDLDKGFLVWDLKTHTSEYISIPNDHAYFTLIAKDNKLQNKVPSHIKELTLRVKYDNCDKVYLQQLQSRYKLKYNLGEVLVQPQSKIQIDTINHDIEDLCDVRDVEKQNTLIKSHLKSLSLEEGVKIDWPTIYNINRECNNILNAQTTPVRNVIWKPLKFTFSNMFSYGPDNEIDFTEYDGVYGVFAPNASGKSTLLDAFMYCIFDRCSKTSRALHVMNNKSKDFKSCLQFELGGKVYEITRNGKRGYNNLVPVTVQFTCIESDGTRTSLNGEDRDSTNKAIRDIVGSYEDFTMTSLSTQNDNQNFIDKSQKDRKELLYKFLDIDIFEDLNKIGREFYRDIQSQVKYIESKGLADKLSKLMEEYKEAKSQASKAEKEVNLDQKALLRVEEAIEKLNKQLIPLTSEINIDQVRASLKSEEEKFGKIAEEAKSYKGLMGKLESEIDSLRPSDALNTKKIQKDLEDIQYELDEKIKQGVEVRGIKSRMHLDLGEAQTHQYDPECKYCIQSLVVKRGKEAEEMIPNLEKAEEVIQRRISELERRKEEGKESLSLYNLITQKSQESFMYESKMQALKVIAEQCRDKVKACYEDIEQYELNQASIVKNAKIEAKIQEQQTTKDEINKKLKQAIPIWNNASKNVGILEHTIQETKASIEELHSLNKTALAYNYYLQAVNRDGIPYGILTKVLPLLESEVNDILSQLVDFTLTLECTDKSAILASIKYGPDRFWPVELASGMERFMLSLALRSALVNITTLPRPNFLAIDEGFGVLDADKVGSIYMLFDYLKTQYTFLICISHLDVMRDLTDKHISIVKQDGASRILG